VRAEDALLALLVAEIEVPQGGAACIPPGASVSASGSDVTHWGDVDCTGRITQFDVLDTLRYVAGLPVQSFSFCPEVGEEIQVSD
jgi:hypothetical protein